MMIETRRLVRQALVGAWAGDSDYYIQPRFALFYRLKAALCLLLNREPQDDPYEDRVAVTYLKGGSYAGAGEPTVHWCTGIYTGYGLLRGWWCCEMYDSD